MRTPMQELIKWFKNERTKYINKAHEESSERMLGFVYKMDDCIKHAESMLQKEKDVMCEFAASCFDEINDQGYRNVIEVIDEHYNETFNTK